MYCDGGFLFLLLLLELFFITVLSFESHYFLSLLQPLTFSVIFALHCTRMSYVDESVMITNNKLN